jgi:hypothetical protein
VPWHENAPSIPNREEGVACSEGVTHPRSKVDRAYHPLPLSSHFLLSEIARDVVVDRSYTSWSPRHAWFMGYLTGLLPTPQGRYERSDNLESYQRQRTVFIGSSMRDRSKGRGRVVLSPPDYGLGVRPTTSPQKIMYCHVCGVS